MKRTTASMKIGIAVLAAGCIAAVAGFVFGYRAYIDALYAETVWRPQVGLLVLVAISVLLIVAGALTMLRSRRRGA